MEQRSGYLVGADIGKTNIRVAFWDGTAQLAELTKRPYGLLLLAV